MRVCLYDEGRGSRCTAKERDSESGLDYFGARYYGSALGRYTSPDPSNAGARIHNPQSWNMYGYTLNNPLRYVDPTGMWPTPIHNAIIDKAFPGLSQSAKDVLKRVSAGQDRLLPGQSRHLAFEHAMRSPSQTPAQAQAQFEQFLAQRKDAAQTSQSGYVPPGATEPNLFAIEVFGELLHAVTDETSPAHEGFQPWDWQDFCSATWLGCDADSVESHTSREGWQQFTPQRQNQAIGAARQWFLSTFGQANYWQAVKGSSSEPKACVETIDSATGSHSKECN
jgi:RHS repeat-associated protein